MGLDVELIRIENWGTSPKRRRDAHLAVVADTRFRLAVAADDPEREVVEATQRLAERCRQDRQLALRFVGD